MKQCQVKALDCIEKIIKRQLAAGNMSEAKKDLEIISDLRDYGFLSEFQKEDAQKNCDELLNERIDRLFNKWQRELGNKLR